MRTLAVGPMPKSLSDTDMAQAEHELEDDMNDSRLLLDDMSASDGQPGDRIWMLLSCMPSPSPIVQLVHEGKAYDAESISQKEKIVMFTIPSVPTASECELRLVLTCEPSLVLSLPFTYRNARRSSMSSFASMDHLVEFATSGETLALLQPFDRFLSRADSHGDTVLHVAAKNSQSSAMKTLLTALPTSNKQQAIDMSNERGQTALHLAVRGGDPDCVHYLMNHGASTNIKDLHGNTAIHYLADAYNDAIYKEILEPARGQTTDLKVINDEGYTALHVAVKRLKLSLIDMLVESGAEINECDSTGRTALMHAVALNDYEIVESLLEKEIDVECEDEIGETALLLAQKSANFYVLGLLLDKGADPKRKNKDGKSLADCQDEMVQNIINGEREEHPVLKDQPPQSTPNDLATTRPKLFGRSIANKNEVPARPVIMQRADQESDEPSSSIHFEDGPSTSAATTSTRSHAHSKAFSKDDVSCLDYLTRLRLSKLLDSTEDGNDPLWQQLAQELGCEHMIEIIRCISEDSSPTMIFLDQYEQMPDSCIQNVRSALERAGIAEAVKLIDERFVY